jgi:hypothetical protein
MNKDNKPTRDPDPYDKLAKTCRKFEWLWKLIDFIRYGKSQKRRKP